MSFCAKSNVPDEHLPPLDRLCDAQKTAEHRRGGGVANQCQRSDPSDQKKNTLAILFTQHASGQVLSNINGQRQCHHATETGPSHDNKVSEGDTSANTIQNRQQAQQHQEPDEHQRGVRRKHPQVVVDSMLPDYLATQQAGDEEDQSSPNGFYDVPELEHSAALHNKGPHEVRKDNSCSDGAQDAGHVKDSVCEQVRPVCTTDCQQYLDQ
mmetsp:Transcript_155056/g.497080  ORF Transcript_155056/g.497080 Transcript_155056/m.497080 type:complete len:210 (-) Transcript_155056:835-1464(-)